MQCNLFLLSVAFELVANEIPEILETVKFLELIVQLTLGHRFDAFDILVELSKYEVSHNCLRVPVFLDGVVDVQCEIVRANIVVSTGEISASVHAPDVRSISEH